MAPAFELRQSVLEELKRLGVGVRVQGREAVQLAHVPLPPGFSARQTELRFSRDGNTFRASAPSELTYDGQRAVCHEALAGTPSGGWRPLILDPVKCRSFEGAVAAALSALGSPACLALEGAGCDARPERTGKREAAAPEAPALERFATRLTAAIERGRWPEIVKRDEELEFIEDALVQYSPDGRVVLVSGEVGSGRWSVGAIGLGQRMVFGTSRVELFGRQIYVLNPASIGGGIMMIGELEERLEQIATEASSGGHVLFIPDGAIQVLRLLPPLHDLRIVARVTGGELETWRAAAPNQMHKATVVNLWPLTREATEAVLAAHLPLLTQHHNLREIDRLTLSRVAGLAEEFLPGALPGSAVRLLEQACAIASRDAQRDGEAAVRAGHLLKAARRLIGHDVANKVLRRWFRGAVSPSEPAGPEAYALGNDANQALGSEEDE